jgi:hypothetical protein
MTTSSRAETHPGRVIRFSIAETLPTLNVLLRLHHRKRKDMLRRVQKLTFVALIESGWRPNHPPAKRVRIRMKRYSGREPDPDGIKSTAKLLLDVLQLSSRSCPCGMGVMVDDSSRCIEDIDVDHVPKRVARTDVEIEVLA